MWQEGEKEGVSKRARALFFKAPVSWCSPLLVVTQRSFKGMPPETQWKDEMGSLKIQWYHQLWVEPLTPGPFEEYTL